MELKNAIVDLKHIYQDRNFIVKKDFVPIPIQIVVKFDEHNSFFRVKKGEKYSSDTKLSFINYIEKSFDLIHPSIQNIMGYSVNKPYLYYKYSQEQFFNIDDIDLTYENIQKILIGLASGLSYLISKGYFYPNFSKSTILINSDYCPKLIDYINFGESNKGTERDLLLKYIEIILMLFKAKKEESNYHHSINENLLLLMNRCRENINPPTFNDFVTFLLKTPFINESYLISRDSYLRSIEYLYLNDEGTEYDSLPYPFPELDSIDKIIYHFYRNKNMVSLSNDDLFLLNSLTENHIKQLTQVLVPLKDKLIRYLYNEDISLIIPNWAELCDKYSKNYPFILYEELMSKISTLERQKNENLYNYKIHEDLAYKIDALKIQAVYYLKSASKIPKIKAQIELAAQYIKGYILPSNLQKALDILDSIKNANESKQALIDRMKERIKKAQKDTKIENIINSIPENQKEILENAQKKQILPMLYAGFAFYTGFNGFPVNHSLSIQFYKQAANESPDAMAILGYLYFNGIFFPQNLKKARKYFRRAAERGCVKAEIIDCLIRKHVWRSYLIDFDINKLFNYYIQSMNASDIYQFPRIYYNLVHDTNKKTLTKLQLQKEEEELKSNCGTFLYAKEIKIKKESIDYQHSEKELFPSYDIKGFNDMEIAKSYYYGLNGFPVNYLESVHYFKAAADENNSEAQWRYAMLCLNSISKEPKDAEYYFRESTKENNIKGKFYYSLFLKQKNDSLNDNLFKTFLKDCCNAEDPDAMYYYAMFLENDPKININQPIEFYKKAAQKGHFDSLIRLNYLYKGFAHVNVQKYLELSVGMLNEKFLVKLIHWYDNKKEYEKSNILIQIGIMLNQQLFNLYYAYHLLYGRGIDRNIEGAKKLANFAVKYNYHPQYQLKYIYLMLQVLVINKEHGNALKFLLQYKDQINEKYTKYFQQFYIKFNKNLAKRYFIPACFCSKDYRMNYDMIVNGSKTYASFTKMQEFTQKENNPFIMAIIGKAYKIGKPVARNLEKAIQYFARSAELQCPLGYYYIGKEYFYGRYLEQNYVKAKKFLLLAIKNKAEPRAGYYLFKIAKYRPELEINGLEMLKIGVLFGHKKALFKYGMLLYNGEGSVMQDRHEAVKCIRQASFQKYQKARKFCVLHNISMKKNRNKKIKSSTKKEESWANIMKKQNEFTESSDEDYDSYSLSSELSINEYDGEIQDQVDHKEDKKKSAINNEKKVFLNFDDASDGDIDYEKYFNTKEKKIEIKHHIDDTLNCIENDY